MFQSHAGSIEAHIEGVVVTRSEFSFNPTLVRLRQLIAAMIAAKLLCFNPTLVRLRHLGSHTK